MLGWLRGAVLLLLIRERPEAAVVLDVWQLDRPTMSAMAMRLAAVLERIILFPLIAKETDLKPS
jgi:hypothetical protein